MKARNSASVFLCLAAVAGRGVQAAMGRTRLRDYFQEQQLRPLASSKEYDDVEELYFTQVLDHFDPSSTKTYQQRYFSTSRYLQEQGDAANGDGKIISFLCVGGEGPGFDKSVLADSVHCSGDMIELAAKLHDRGYSVHTYALEHRYYGESYPKFEEDDESPLTIEKLKYLSSRQALEDLAHFVQSTNKILCPDCDNDAVTWVTFGGSYPGYLAGMARYKYPHLISAAVSNSAPLKLKVDFPEYKTRVGWDLQYGKIGGSFECYDIVKQGHVQAAATKPEVLAKMFRVCDADNALLDKNNIGMLLGDGLIDVPAQVNDPSCASEMGKPWCPPWKLPWPDCNHRHHPHPPPPSPSPPQDENLCNIQRLCDAMTTDQRTRNVSELEILANIAGKQNKAQGRLKDDDDCIDLNWNKMLERFSQPTIDSFGTRSWLWQTCTEVGFYQTCESECPFGNYYHLVDMDLEICRVAYNVTNVYENVQATLDHYGGLDISGASRILSVNGDVDPWSVLGLHESPKYSLPVEMVAGASHHFWTHAVKDTDAQEIVDIRKYIYSVVMAWLDIDEDDDKNKVDDVPITATDAISQDVALSDSQMLRG